MKNRIAIVLLFLNLIPLQRIAAQSDIPIYETEAITRDITARVGAEVKIDLTRTFSVTFEEELRLKNGFSEFDRSYSMINLTNRFNDYFKIGAGYTFMSIWHDGKKSTDYLKYWDIRNRFNFDLTFSYSLVRWKFILRERLLSTSRTGDYDKQEKVSPEYLLRSKLQVEYSLLSKPVKPYFSFELSNTLNVPSFVNEKYIDKMRFDFGVKYRFNQKNSINLFYRFVVGNNYDVNIDYKVDKINIKAVEIVKERDFINVVGLFYNFN